MDDKQPEDYVLREVEFTKAVTAMLDDTKSEVAKRNEKISKLDEYIYGEGLTNQLKIPSGHDKTEVNWLRRVVEIHADQFMGNGFQIISTYDTQDITTVEGDDKKRIKTENKSSKNYAEERQKIIDSIIEDNGGVVFFKELALNAGAIGNSVVKSYYDEDEKRWVLSQVEAIENFYAIWSSNDFRQVDAVAYVSQISLQKAAQMYGCNETTPTSPLGQPLKYQYSTNMTTISDQKMVTVMEVTGKINGWKVEKGKIVPCELGQETELNALIVGDRVKRLITDTKKLPRYYILPNKRERRRPWGVSDITDAAIDINLTYIETLSDWRTVASKVNFPKFKALGFGDDVQIPKPKPRTVEVLPLADGQDIQFINQGDANQTDFNQQLEELEKQFVRETGISRVLFSDPSITLNSNQALMTSMKPTTDIAQSKKFLWAPILKQIFDDALETLAEYDDDVKELVKSDDNWKLKVIYPDFTAKYDPAAFSMLLNRFNAGLISSQSFVEQLGESKEEIDRIADEMEDPVTSAIVAKQLPLLYQSKSAAATTPSAGGGTSNPMVSTPANNTEGNGIMSQPGSGATTASPEGALANANQNAGQ